MFVLTQGPLVNSPNIDKQLLFPIGSPNCTLSTFPGWEGGRVGKCVTKENPKSDLDLGLRVCQKRQLRLTKKTCHENQTSKSKEDLAPKRERSQHFPSQTCSMERAVREYVD